MDYSRILSINETYIKSINEDILFDRLVDFANNYKKPFKESKLNTLKKSISFLKNKAKTLQDIYNNCQFIILEEIKINKEEKELIDKNSKLILTDFINDYKKINDVKRESSEIIIKSLIDRHKTNLKGVGQPLRISLTGLRFGPGIYDILLSLTKEEVIKRITKTIDE